MGKEMDIKQSKAKAFNDNLKFVNCIELSEGGYFGGVDNYIVIRDGDNIASKMEHFELHDTSENDECIGDILWDKKQKYKRAFCDITWDELMEQIAKLNIGEWESEYVDPHILDGTQWSITLKYDGGIADVEYSGSNKFPHNYRRFLSVMKA